MQIKNWIYGIPLGYDLESKMTECSWGDDWLRIKLDSGSALNEDSRQKEKWTIGIKDNLWKNGKLSQRFRLINSIVKALWRVSNDSLSTQKEIKEIIRKKSFKRRKLNIKEIKEMGLRLNRFIWSPLKKEYELKKLKDSLFNSIFRHTNYCLSM